MPLYAREQTLCKGIEQTMSNGCSGGGEKGLCSMYNFFCIVGTWSVHIPFNFKKLAKSIYVFFLMYDICRLKVKVESPTPKFKQIYINL